MNNRKTQIITSVLLLFVMLIGVMPVGIMEVEATSLTISDLPTGSIVYDSSWSWEHKTGNGYIGSGQIKPIEWLIVAKNHYENNQVTLLSNELIAKQLLDNSTDRGSINGSNHWGDSGTSDATEGLRPWLNTVLYNSFGEEFKSAIIDTIVPNMTHKKVDYNTTDKVFLSSQTELGGGISNTYEIGESYGYFNTDESRIAKLNNTATQYWSRSPYNNDSYGQVYVRPTGSFSRHNANDTNHGIRPTVNLKSETPVYKDSGGKYSLFRDATPPVVKVTANITAATNQNVTLTVSATDDSGVKRIQLPTGTWVNGARATHVVTTNGTYTFKAEDNFGNIGTREITITNIDKVAPVITFNDYVKIPTNEDITITATTSKGSLNKASHIFTANGSFEFIATDTAGNITKKVVTITNIDKVAPVITFNDYVKVPTNENITITATANKGTLNKESHTFTANGSFEFVATDLAGNITKKVVTITNIDKVAPIITIPTYVTTPTNKDVIVTATTNKGSLNKASHTFTINGSFEFVATDLAGNVTKKTVTITNIDKVAPVITFNDYKTEPTNQDITVTAIASKGTLNKESHTFTANGSFEFIATDAVGNVTKKTVTITNIDKVAPVITIEEYVMEPTNQNITVTVKASKGSLNKESHTFEANGSFEFIATDVAGNVTKQTVTITNIDKTLPVITFNDYIKTPTNKDIVVKATANKGSLNKASHTFTENGSFEFIATDLAGNVAKEMVTIANIDKSAPVITIGNYNKTVTNQNVIVTATTNKGTLNKESHTFEANGSFEFIATDVAGNVTKQTVTITNIDKTLPVITFNDYIKTPTNKDIVVKATANKGSLNKASHTFTENGSFEFIATDLAGNVTKEMVTIANIDKSAPVITIDNYNKTVTNQNVIVTATTNKGTLNKDSHTFTANGSFEFVATDVAGNITKQTVTITNIDKVAPTITFNDYIKTPTNQDIVVTATANKGSLNKASHTFTENGSFEFIATDLSGNVTKETVIITNIDRVLPVITIDEFSKKPTNQNIIVTATTSKGSLNKEAHTFTGNGSFEFVVTDIYGNIAKETVTITNIDKVAPVITLTSSETNPTNKSVTITVEATDNLSGISEIELHDKSVVKVDKATFIVEVNGTYSFKVTDKAGNVTVKEITVSNIDKFLPVITIGEYTTAPTNQNIVVTATTSKGTLNKEAHTFTEDSSFEFVVTDAAGNIAKEKVEINNIDKVAPTKPLLTFINDKIVLKEATDADSGIEKHMYSINNSPFENWTSNLDTTNFKYGLYRIVVKAIDRASNETLSDILSFTISYEEVRNVIDEVEETLDREDYDKAKHLVGNMEDGDLKDELLDKLKEILNKIEEKEFEELIAGYINNESDLKDIEEAIKDSNLPEDIVIGLINKINKKATEIVTDEIGKIEETLTRDDYNYIKEKIDNLVPSPEKDELEERLKNILDKIEEVEFADLIGGMEKVEDVKKAGDSIKDSDLPEDVKEDLLDQLDKKIRELTSWSVGIAEAVSREPYLGTAQAFVNLLKESPEKDAFQARMDAIDVKLTTNTELALKDAERVVALAEANKREASITNAKKVIKALQTSSEKAVFEQRIQDLEDVLAEEVPVVEVKNTEAQIKAAENSVALAEKMKRAASINNARKLVNNLKESAEKTAFIERLDNI